MKNTVYIAFIVLILLSLPSHAHARECDYVISVPMVEGLEETSLGKYLEQLSEVLSNKLDCNITSKKLVYNYGQRIIDRVRKEFDEGVSDVSYVFGIEYAQYARSGKDDLVPLFTLSIDGRTMMDQCFYVRKGEYSDVSELEGKKWAGALLLPARFLLYSEGIDEPVDEFFGSIRYQTDAPLTGLLDMLESGEIDVFNTFGVIMRLSGELNKKDAFFEPLLCREYDHTWVFVARKGVSPKFIELTRRIMLNAHNDPDFATFSFAFKLLDGHFVPLDDSSIEKINRIVDLAEKGGWFDEQREFAEKYVLKKKEEKEE